MSTPYPNDKPKTNDDPRKSDGTLNFGDLTSSMPPRVRHISDPNRPLTQTPAESNPVADQNTTAPDVKTNQPSNASNGPTLPVFRNPQGNAHRADLAEIGAPIDATSTIAEHQTKQLTNIRFNLSTSFDTF